MEKKKSANPDTQNKFALAISSIKAYLLRSQNIITWLVVMNKQICCALSNIQLTPYCFSTGDHVSLNCQVNTRLLYPVDVVSRFFDPHTFTHLVQQNSYLWHHSAAESRWTTLWSWPGLIRVVARCHSNLQKRRTTMPPHSPGHRVLLHNV